MTTEAFEVVVVGAGQAGVAMSEHLTNARNFPRCFGARSNRRTLANRTLGFSRGKWAGLA